MGYIPISYKWKLLIAFILVAITFYIWSFGVVACVTTGPLALICEFGNFLPPLVTIGSFILVILKIL